MLQPVAAVVLALTLLGRQRLGRVTSKGFVVVAWIAERKPAV